MVERRSGGYLLRGSHGSILLAGKEARHTYKQGRTTRGNKVSRARTRTGRGVSGRPSVEPGLASGEDGRWFNNSNAHLDDSLEVLCR